MTVTQLDEGHSERTGVLDTRERRIQLYYLWECGLLTDMKGLSRPLQIVSAGQLQL